MDAGWRVGGLLGTVSLAAVLVGAAATGACRDAPELHEPPELAPLGPAPYQLTFDPGRDVAPTWSASGDSIIYATEEVLPPRPGTGEDSVRTGRPLRVIHREGGVAGRVFPLLQPDLDRTVPIDYAAQSSDGRIAAFTLLPPQSEATCGAPVVDCMPAPTGAPPPQLESGLLRVRTSGADAPPSADPLIEVAFPGRSFDTSQNPEGIAGVWRIETYPFQRQFSLNRRAPDRVSWHPDGDRLVYSNGVELRTWNPSTGSVTSIPDSRDGVNPAWSPTGEWIAFERYVRGPLTEVTCEYRLPPSPTDTVPGPLQCVQERRSWPLMGRNIALIRPDGTDLRILAPGARPSWSADEERVYYESGQRIWSVGVDGEGATPVPGTQAGLMPAVSPDGRWLAFARFDSVTRTSDIWVVELEE